MNFFSDRNADAGSAEPALPRSRAQGAKRGMELAFETLTLRRACESDIEARKRYPQGTVDQLQERLADMRAAKSASDLVAGRPAIDAQPPGHIVFILDEGYELVCVGNHPSPPLTADGLVDLDRIRRIRIAMIVKGQHYG